MDILGAATTGTAAVPWLVLGVFVGVGLVLLAGAVTALALRRRRAAAPDDPGTDDPRTDDLAGFLESPPGTAAAATPAGWASLAAPPAHPPPAPHPRRDVVLSLGAMALTAVLLLAVAAAVAATSRADDRPARTRQPAAATPATGVAARLTFGGVVLEPRAVGVTATYPVVEITTEGDRTRVRVEFPTYNCLTADAPADPEAAGCARAPTEYAELTGPDLAARRHGDGLEISGRFATEVHPFGGAPTATGRVYALRITAAPAHGTAEDGWRPARGVLELGPERSVTVDDPGVNVLRSAS